MLAFLEHVCHEVNPEAYKLLQNQDLEKAASEMVTAGELESCFRKAVDIIIESKDKKEDIRNYAIRRAINYIREHYSENITLDDLAASIHLSKSECCRCFKRTLQLTPFEYLMKYRIFRAASILQMNVPAPRSMSALAFSVGFNNASYFNKVFKQYLHCTPSEYKRKIKNNPTGEYEPFYGLKL